MSTTIPAASPSATVRAVFGDRVPADAAHALAQLEQSPLAPRDAAALQAARSAVLEAAAAELERLQADGYKIRERPAPPATGRGMPAAMALRLQEMTRPLDPSVSPARAKELFDAIAGAEDIPHDFVDEGCHNRAHVAALRLEDAGVYSEKVLLRPLSGADLRIDSDKTPLGFTLGIFHIAPAVLVKQPDGSVERQVIDPSLFDEPVSVARWQSKMEPLDKGECELLVMPRFAFHLSDRYNPPTSWQPKDLEDAAAWNGQYKALWQDMVDGGFYDHLQEAVEEARERYG